VSLLGSSAKGYRDLASRSEADPRSRSVSTAFSRLGADGQACSMPGLGSLRARRSAVRRPPTWPGLGIDRITGVALLVNPPIRPQ
jgi:hypothetical protein